MNSEEWEKKDEIIRDLRDHEFMCPGRRNDDSVNLYILTWLVAVETEGRKIGNAAALTKEAVRLLGELGIDGPGGEAIQYFYDKGEVMMGYLPAWSATPQGVLGYAII